MMLNYDRGSKTYAAYSRNNLFYNGSTDEAIRCGAISQNGCIAHCHPDGECPDPGDGAGFPPARAVCLED